MKSRPVEAELFHADRRTDVWKVMTRPAIALLNFAKATENKIFNHNKKHTSICRRSEGKPEETDLKILDASSVT